MPLTPLQAQQAISVLENTQKRTELLRTLHAIAQAAPAAVPAAAAPNDGTEPAVTPAPAPDASAPLTSGGLIAQLASGSASWFADLSSELAETARGLSQFDSFTRWAQRVAGDTQDRVMLLGGAWRLLVALSCGLGAEWLARRALRSPFARAGSRRRDAATLLPTPPPGMTADPATAPSHLLQRLPLALARMLLDLLPVAGFAGIANLLILVTGGDETTNAVLGISINAYAIWRGITVLTRSILSPDSPQLRLFAIADDTAHYLDRWVARLAGIAVFGLALVEVAGLVGLYPAAYRTLSKLVLLIDHVMLAFVVLQSRRRVASWIQAPPGASGAASLVRNRLAALWHAIALFLIVASWIVFAAEIQNGYLSLLRLACLTLLAMFGARLLSILALGATDRLIATRPGQKLPDGSPHPTRLYLMLRRLVRILVACLTLLVVLEVWGFDAMAWFADGIGRRLLSATLTIGFAAVAAMAIWEWINVTIERYLQRLAHDADHARLARMRTLLPILRTTLLGIILVIVGLTALGELGVNIAPMLAGAGIIGIAVGFGSQKLVQDVITGVFLLVENALQVGDYVTVADFSGKVEHLSIRSIRLRAIDGSVHIVPFSSVTSVTNSSRDSAKTTITVTAAISEDIDRIEELLKQIAAEIRREPQYQKAIRGDIELWGVEKLDAAGVTITAHIRCTAEGRWSVQREFNRRLTARLHELGIKLVEAA